MVPFLPVFQPITGPTARIVSHINIEGRAMIWSTITAVPVFQSITGDILRIISHINMEERAMI